MIKKSTFILLSILLVGSAIRLYNPAFRCLWGDEIDSLFRIYNFSAHNFHFERTNLFETLARSVFVPLKGSHLPGYYILLSLWAFFLGAGEYNLRLISIILGIFSIPLIFLLAKEIFGEKTAAISAFLLSVSGFAVFYSQEIRPYSFMLFFSLLSTLFFWKLIKEGKGAAMIVGYIISSMLLALSHLFGVLIIVAQALYLLFDVWKEKKLFGHFSAAISIGVIFLLLLPVYLPFLFSGVSKLAAVGEEVPFTAIPSYFKVLLAFFVLSIGESVAPWNVRVVLPAAIVFGFLFIKSFWRFSDKRVVFLLTLLVFPVLFSSILIKLTLPKYLIMTLPYYLILIGYSISLLPSTWFRSSAVFIIFVIQSAAIVNYYSLSEYHNANQLEPWREVSGIIKSGYRAGDTILASSYDIIYRELEYYLNISGNNNYPVHILSFGDRKRVNLHGDDNYPLLIADVDRLSELSGPRIWLVTHLRDSRKLPPGALIDLEGGLDRNYKLVMKKDFVPYEETIISKLPFIKHEPGSSRITLRLFVIK